MIMLIMYKTNISSYKSLVRKRVYALIIVLVILIIGVGIIAFARGDDEVRSTAQTTSDVESAQSDFSSDDATKRVPETKTGSAASGGIVDTGGTGSAPESTQDPISSGSGEISVAYPSKNATITSGTIVTGTSSLSTVHYRIVGENVGMISTGSLKVSNGKFSGTLQFQTSSKNGKLDFFGTKSDGNEFSNLSIPVIFR